MDEHWPEPLRVRRPVVAQQEEGHQQKAQENRDEQPARARLKEETRRKEKKRDVKNSRKKKSTVGMAYPNTYLLYTYVKETVPKHTIYDDHVSELKDTIAVY